MPARSDENRIIIAVTGANSGVGLGYCHRILRQLSTPPPSPPPDALLTTLTHTSTPSSLATTDSRYSAYSSTSPPATLTLILACRSRSKAEVAIKSLRKEHELGLIGRKMRGYKEREGWLEGLEIVFEELDVDKVGGQGGVLDFSRRICENYPHLTTLVLNAGIAAVTAINWPKAFQQLATDPITAVSAPNYMIEEYGRLSGDGLRGGVWGVNVLSTYILAKELRSHLRKSPNTLPLSPRILYVSSAESKPSFLPSYPSKDPQLLAGKSYGASKYMADIVTSRLDWDFNSVGEESQSGEGDDSRRQVRVMRLDPGIVWTGISGSYTPVVMQWLMAAVFYLARWIGSRVHTISSDNAALGLTWLTLVPEVFLEPAQSPSTPNERPGTSSGSDTDPLLTSDSGLESSPSKYVSQCWRTGRPYVRLSRVAQWEKFATGPEGGDGFLAECDKVYGEWKEREKRGKDELPRVEEGAKTD